MFVSGLSLSWVAASGIEGIAVPPYRRTAVPPYRRTAVPPYLVRGDEHVPRHQRSNPVKQHDHVDDTPPEGTTGNYIRNFRCNQTQCSDARQYSYIHAIPFTKQLYLFSHFHQNDTSCFNWLKN